MSFENSQFGSPDCRRLGSTSISSLNHDGRKRNNKQKDYLQKPHLVALLSVQGVSGVGVRHQTIIEQEIVDQGFLNSSPSLRKDSDKKILISQSHEKQIQKQFLGQGQKSEWSWSSSSSISINSDKINKFTKEKSHLIENARPFLQDPRLLKLKNLMDKKIQNKSPRSRIEEVSQVSQIELYPQFVDIQRTFQDQKSNSMSESYLQSNSSLQAHFSVCFQSQNIDSCSQQGDEYHVEQSQQQQNPIQYIQVASESLLNEDIKFLKKEQFENDLIGHARSQPVISYMKKMQRILDEYRIQHSFFPRWGDMGSVFCFATDVMIQQPLKYKQVCIMTEYPESILQHPVWSASQSPPEKLTTIVISSLNFNLNVIPLMVCFWDEKRETNKVRGIKKILRFFHDFHRLYPRLLIGYIEKSLMNAWEQLKKQQKIEIQLFPSYFQRKSRTQQLLKARITKQEELCNPQLSFFIQALISEEDRTNYNQIKKELYNILQGILSPQTFQQTLDEYESSNFEGTNFCNLKNNFHGFLVKEKYDRKTVSYCQKNIIGKSITHPIQVIKRIASCQAHEIQMERVYITKQQLGTALVQQLKNRKVWNNIHQPNNLTYQFGEDELKAIVRKVEERWECSCGLQIVMEIPCTHLLQVLTNQNEHYKQYVSQRYTVQDYADQKY